MSLSPLGTPIRVAALYRFARIDDPVGLRDALTAICCRDGIYGTLLVASEGMNGTVAAAGDGLDALLAFFDAHPALRGLNIRFSDAAEMPFRRMKVRLKREIVTMGVEGIDPTLSAGTYVEPEDWNALISESDTIVVDTRNGYETALGTFRGAVDPGTASFREFPEWARRNRQALEGRKVAMFCTGGIRCEKATAFMKSLGVDRVFHLKGGVLSYLESVAPQESLWDGECFVFDERVSLTHGLQEGKAELCRACRRPLTPAERASSLYREGVSCPHCHAEKSAADRARYAERQRQVGIAEQRALPPHIGGGQP